MDQAFNVVRTPTSTGAANRNYLICFFIMGIMTKTSSISIAQAFLGYLALVIAYLALVIAYLADVRPHVDLYAYVKAVTQFSTKILYIVCVKIPLKIIYTVLRWLLFGGLLILIQIFIVALTIYLTVIFYQFYNIMNFHVGIYNIRADAWNMIMPYLGFAPIILSFIISSLAKRR